tara:strand:- start:4727 stop:4987 length:261 start_codon:yes stop_codon:yes gene_type:complete
MSEVNISDVLNKLQEKNINNLSEIQKNIFKDISECVGCDPKDLDKKLDDVLIKINNLVVSSLTKDWFDSLKRPESVKSSNLRESLK